MQQPAVKRFPGNKSSYYSTSVLTVDMFVHIERWTLR